MTDILIIDDEPQIRDMLRLIFEHEGYDVIDAPDGRIALKLQQENPTKLVITDIVMPEKEGLETIRELRKNYPEVKIIAMSGGGFIEPQRYLNLAAKFGAERIFTKPIELEELLMAVKELSA